jgi:hypothetical protein
MSAKDYSEDEDFYTQGFEKAGFVSVWVGIQAPDALADVLQDLCGVGAYNPDYQESNNAECQEESIASLIGPLSYSNSFLAQAVNAAAKKNIEVAKWVLAQYEFKYDPSVVLREIMPDPVFIGHFPYHIDAAS